MSLMYSNGVINMAHVPPANYKLNYVCHFVYHPLLGHTALHVREIVCHSAPQLLQVNECHFVCGTQPRPSRNVTRLL